METIIEATNYVEGCGSLYPLYTDIIDDFNSRHITKVRLCYRKMLENYYSLREHDDAFDV
jgi:hypothetical protein